MKRKFKMAAVQTLTLSMVATTALTGLGAPLALAAPSVPPILITELLPDSSNVGSDDGFEYVELYNASDNWIDLNGYKLKGIYVGTTGWTGTINGSFKIPPRETVIIWTQNSTVSKLSPQLTRDQFRGNYGKTADELADERIYIMQNISGLYNGDGAKNQTNITITLISPSGSDIVNATYYLGTGTSAVDDTVKDQGISFKEPASGIAMVHNGGNKDATPGRIATDEVLGTAPVDAVAVGGERSLTLSWTPNSDPSVTGYRIYSRDGLPAASVTGATYQFSGLTNGSDYSFTVSSVYANGSVSPASAPFRGKAGIPVTPAPVSGLQALPRDQAIRLSWDPVTDGTVASYELYKDGVKLSSTVTGSTYNVTGLTNGQSVTFAVYAIGTTGLKSALPATATQKPQAAPTLVLTEMAPNTKNADYKTGGTDAFEFIELYNSTSTPINLKGFTLKYIAGATEYKYPINEDKIVPAQGTFIIWFKNSGVQQVGLTEFNLAYGSAITEEQLFVVVNGGMSNSASRRVQMLDPDNIVLSDTAYNVEDVGESISANFIPDRSNGVVSSERFSKPANPGFLYPVQKVADPSDTAPPAAPTGVQIIAGVGGIKATWSEALEPDVAYVNVYVNNTVSAKLLMPEKEAVIEGLDNGSPVTVQLSTIDTAGRESARTAPVTVTPSIDAMPKVMITEIVPDSWNTEPLDSRSVYDAHEFVELYNPQAQPIDLMGKTLRFTPSADPTKTWSWTFNSPTLIGAKQSLLFWVRPAGLEYLKTDGFNYSYYGPETAKYIPDSSIVLGDGAGGLTNSGGVVEIVESDGTVIVSAAYTSGQFEERKGITYAYPMFGGVEMRTSGTLQDPTPGMVEPGQFPRESFADQTAPAAPAGLQAAPGRGEATVSWLPNTEPDLAGYRLYVGGKLDITLPAGATSYTIPGLRGQTAVTVELSSVDQSGNESARTSANVTPDYAVMTQVERDPSPANALTESSFQQTWDSGEKGPVIPGLVQGHVPQGMSYYADSEREWIFMAAYHYTGDPSTLAVVDAKTGQLVKYVNLKNPDGTVYTGHAGGVAVSRDNIWLSSGSKVYRMPVQTLIDAQNQGFAKFADTFSVVTNASFTAYANGILWVGEYSNPPSYTTNASHSMQSRNGETHLAWIAGYEIGDNDLPKSNVPSYIFSIGDKIQGVEFNNGEIFVTYNYGRPYNSIVRYAMPDLSDLSTKNGETTISGVSVPVWLLDSVNQIGSTIVPTGAENMFFRKENGVDQLYVNFESGANHTRFMSSYSMDRLLKMDLNLLRAYDTRSLTHVPQIMNIGAEAQAAVLANRGKSNAENVTAGYTWTSSDTAVAEVSSSGLIRGKMAGMATITGTSGSSVLTASVEVASPDSISAAPPVNGKMTAGTTFQLAVKTVYAGLPEGDVTSQASYTVKGKTGALAVNSTGLVTAIKPGLDTITVSFAGKSLDLDIIVVGAGSGNNGSNENNGDPEDTSSGSDNSALAGGNSGGTVGSVTGNGAGADVKEPGTQQTVTLDTVPANGGPVQLELAGGQTALVVSPEAMDALKGAALEVKQGGVNLVIPGEALKAAAGSIGQAEAAAPQTTVSVIPASLPVNTAERTAASQAFTFGLSVETANGPAAVKQLQQPVEVQVKLEAVRDSRLVGLYAVQPDGSLTYVGGHVTNGVLTAEVTMAGTYVAIEYTKSYTDVPTNHWASEALQVLAAKHVAEGGSGDRFAPDEAVTRAEYTALLVRAFGLDAGGVAGGQFDDVEPTAWYNGAVQAASSNGLVSGVDASRFAPDEPITREQMAVLLVRAWERQHGTVQQEGAAGFTDASNIADWAAEAVSKAKSAGLLGGKDGDRFDPKASATRAESAQAIFNVLFK
ncbi:hypothetical protein PAESOLCIP111_00423 [Paenibacillus solanacearum]|uniref:S-layer homology domain-containing protein n=1 Tax=Paenibacillus solanacearum TaxID=2048548 RepID=A0A916JV94_9BACL|nr:lamin tail domain-containing protein [Paenibacillus solanacearum]CAG7600739.1 hypothetical protein PAESOLCIP111_00423 [Paenibacillus solanacearum]